MRLTDHLEKDSMFTCDEKSFVKCYKKLSQLEDILEGHNIETLEEFDGLLWYVKQVKDIEEELGIDLITLFKALKNGIWLKDKKDQYMSYHCLLRDDFILVLYEDIYKKEYLLKDYGKTWALTKEELE